MTYELWDTRTTNLIADVDNESDALALVLSGIERNGPHDTDTLILEVEDEAGNPLYSLQGADLAALARQKRVPAESPFSKFGTRDATSGRNRQGLLSTSAWK